MKRVVMLAMMMTFVLAIGAMAQSNGNGNTGQQYQYNHRNQYLQDADGDGIPNGQDSDYIRPVCDSTCTGSRYQFGHRFANTIRDGVGSTVDAVHGLWIRLRDRLRIDQ